MKKYRKYLLLLTLCMLVSNVTGCKSLSKDAKKIYEDTITQMNKDIYYFKGTAKNYQADTLYNTMQIEQLKEKDNKLSYISSTILAKDENIGELAVMDGKNIHKLSFNKRENTNTYSVDTIDKDAMENLELFINIFNNSMPLKNSSVTNTTKGVMLYFVFQDESMASENAPRQEYTITIENNKIIEMDMASYGTGNDIVTMRTVTTYSDFNAANHINTKSIIQEMITHK